MALYRLVGVLDRDHGAVADELQLREIADLGDVAEEQEVDAGPLVQQLEPAGV